ncbi:MAG: histidine kinase [Bacteroidota bacterium]
MWTLEFWRNRFFFFIGIWVFTLIVACSVLFLSIGSLNIVFWNSAQNISIRAIFNFGSYVVIFSIVIEVLSKRFPYNGKWTWFRLLLSVLTGLVVSYISALINSQFPFPERMSAAGGDFLFVFIMSFFQCGMTFTTLEIWEMTKRNRKLSVSLAELEKEKMQSQLQALRQQVNPHFLFNSLNVLSELIHEDIEKSDLFIQHFSKVYRYALELNQESVVTVEKELEFLRSYIFLQKIRFGDSLRITTICSQFALQAHVPPLSLQLLFENAIKHNIITATLPLHIEMKCENGTISMKNNLQKLRDSAGTGIGLKNLGRKYKLISEQSPRFYIRDGFYIAELPLIQLET